MIEHGNRSAQRGAHARGGPQSPRETEDTVPFEIIIEPDVVPLGTVRFDEPTSEVALGGLAKQSDADLDPLLGTQALEHSVTSALISLLKFAAASGAIVAGLYVSYLTYREIRVDQPLTRHPAAVHGVVATGYRSNDEGEPARVRVVVAPDRELTPGVESRADDTETQTVKSAAGAEPAPSSSNQTPGGSRSNTATHWVRKWSERLLAWRRAHSEPSATPAETASAPLDGGTQPSATKAQGQSGSAAALASREPTTTPPSERAPAVTASTTETETAESNGARMAGAPMQTKALVKEPGETANESANDNAAAQAVKPGAPRERSASSADSNKDDLDPLMLAAEALSLQENGRLEQAKAAWARLLERSPENPTALVNLAAIAVESGALEQAQSLLEEALRIAPRMVSAHVNLGDVYARRGELDAAERAFRRALEIEPTHRIAHRNLAVVLDRRGRVEEALAELDAIDAETSEPALYGRMLLRAKKPKRARVLLERALAAEPTATDTEIDLAAALRMLGELDAALQHLERALARAPRSARAYVDRANVHLAAGRLDEAKRDYERALEIDPGSALAHYDYALLAERYGHYVAAIEGYERVLKIDPEHAPAWNNLGRIYLRAGESHKALEHFERALALEPERIDAALNRGLALAALGRKREAVRALKGVEQRLDPSDRDRPAIRRLLEDLEATPR